MFVPLEPRREGRFGYPSVCLYTAITKFLSGMEPRLAREQLVLVILAALGEQCKL
jgi:hypothetical protein